MIEFYDRPIHLFTFKIIWFQFGHVEFIFRYHVSILLENHSLSGLIQAWSRQKKSKKLERFSGFYNTRFLVRSYQIPAGSYQRHRWCCKIPPPSPSSLPSTVNKCSFHCIQKTRGLRRQHSSDNSSLDDWSNSSRLSTSTLDRVLNVVSIEI